MICVSPAFSRTICVKLTSSSSLEVSENRVNLRNFLVDSLTLFPLKPPFLLFLCRGWDRILSIASVYCILKPTRDTLIAVAICVGIHISPDISLWHCDTVTPRHARRPRKTKTYDISLWHCDTVTPRHARRLGLEKPCIFGGKRTWHNMTFYI